MVGAAAAVALMAIAGSGAAGASCARIAQGSGISVDGITCTIGSVTSSAGHVTGVTARHCGSPGAVVRDLVGRRVGTVAGARDASENAVVDIDAGVPVTPSRVVADAQVRVGDALCKVGARTGVTCGRVAEVGASTIAVAIIAGPGDSGAAGTVAGRTVGYLQGALRRDPSLVQFSRP